MYLLLVILPLLSALFTLGFGQFIGSAGAAILTTSLVCITFLLSLFSFYEVALHGSACYFQLFEWFNSDLVLVYWGFYFDTLTVVMLCVITFISTLVHMYSISYMHGDPHMTRFMSYLSLFTFFMIILVTGDNFIQLFVGWEGVGVCSYLLINFWHTRLQANKAAIKAMLVNRIGDLGLFLGILVFYKMFKTVEFSTLFALCPLILGETFTLFFFEFDLLTVGTFLLFIGAVGKSAQLGLHTWLPDAMEGPTPVSALIHAATMVTAGVYLISRCSPIFEYCPTTLLIITIAGASTALFGATVALFQNDLKKVIAYSTCSQLGYMILICGLSHYHIGIFHLFNHAFFKALLFLGAGAIIHAMNDEQDFRRMGGLRKVLPFSYAIMVVGSLSLMGLPFLTGFYSKDAILEVAFAHYTIFGHTAYSLGVLAAFFTSFYSIRLVYFVFLAKTNAFRQVISLAHEANWLIVVPLTLLMICSIFIGFCFKDMFIGLGTPFWGNAIFILPHNYLAIDSEFLPASLKLLPNVFVFGGALSSFFIYRYFFKFVLTLQHLYYLIYIFFNKKWFFDKVYTETIIQSVLQFTFHLSYKVIDKGLLEVVGPKGIVETIHKISMQLLKLQSGFVVHYAYIMILSGFLGCLSLIFNLNFGFLIILFIFQFYTICDL